MYRLSRVPCQQAGQSRQTEIEQRAPVALISNEHGINNGIEWD